MLSVLRLHLVQAFSSSYSFLSALVDGLIGRAVETTFCCRPQMKVGSCSIGVEIADGKNKSIYMADSKSLKLVVGFFYALEGHSSPVRHARRLDPLPAWRRLLQCAIGLDWRLSVCGRVSCRSGSDSV